jgi:Fe-S oxidoreductase
MLSSISGLLRRGSILHMGCKNCGNEESYLGVKVLNKLGVEPDINEFSCGCDYFGMDEDKIISIAEENKHLLKGYSLAIVGCARCYHVMRKYYKYIKVKHISQIIFEKLPDSDYGGSGEVFYHDPCFLARYEHLTENPRKVLETLGYSVREFKNNRTKTDCCGGYSPIRALRDRASDMRLDTIPKKSAITSPCPKCTQNFLTFNKSNDKSIRHFLELVDDALGIEIAAVC